MALSNQNETFATLNPYTPMAFLPPKLAYEAQAMAFIQVGALGMSLWDILTNLKNDYKMLKKYPFGWDTLFYLLSRLSTLGFEVSSALFLSGAEVSCERMTTSILVFISLAISSTTALSFLHVRGMYSGRPIMQNLFLILLLIRFATSGPLAFLSFKGIPIAPTKSCMFLTGIRLNRIVISVGVLSRLMYDTLVFMAIVHMVASISNMSSVSPQCEKKSRSSRGAAFFSLFLTGNTLFMQSMPWSRTLLKTERRLYLISMLSSIPMLIVVFNPKIGDYYSFSAVPPSVALMNAVTCYVFRKIKMEKMRKSNSVTSTFISRELAFRTGPYSTNAQLNEQQNSQPDVLLESPVDCVPSERFNSTRSLPARIRDLRAWGILRRSASANC